MLTDEQRLAESRSRSQLPLVWRKLDQPFARLTTPLAIFANHLGDVSTAEFVQHCRQLAEKLPERQHVVNLCENPYLFTVAFGAAILRGQTTLLPQNRSTETLRHLAAQYNDVYLLHTGPSPVPDLVSTDVSNWRLSGTTAENTPPTIERDLLAAIAFTSGSTGTPKAIPKPWHTLVTSALMNGQCMLPSPDELIYQIATVPPQHMWGLETGVMMPLMWPVCVADSRPLFPHDISRALHNLPTRRLLVTTPVHLRALLGSGVVVPACCRTLCATAPLATELAVECERATSGDLLEVYGCSEIGSTAYRQPSRNTDWRLIPGLFFKTATTPPYIGGDHLPAVQALPDQVEIVNDGFRLLGRNEDMINVGGKRGSLMQITQVLLGLPGVEDAAVFIPQEVKTASERPAAMVVCSEAQRPLLGRQFAQHLDPVFFPRPLLFVDQLPRQTSGKLHRADLLELFRQMLTLPNKRSFSESSNQPTKP